MQMADKMQRILKKFEERILLALYKYYLSDITFERAAEEANVPIYFLIQYVNHNNLPIVHTEEDVRIGIEKVRLLMGKTGMDTKKLPLLA